MRADVVTCDVIDPGDGSRSLQWLSKSFRYYWFQYQHGLYKIQKFCGKFAVEKVANR